MKKILLSALLISSVAVQAKNIASIDTNLILMNSKAGKKFEQQKETARLDFQKTLTKKQEEISKLKQDLAEKVQKGLITESDFRVQLSTVELKERRAEFDVQEHSAQLQNKLKNQEAELRQNIAVAAKEVAKAQEWSVVLDVHAPGVIYVNADIDGSPEVLKACDKTYEANRAKSALSTETKVEKKEVLKS